MNHRPFFLAGYATFQSSPSRCFKSCGLRSSPGEVDHSHDYASSSAAIECRFLTERNRESSELESFENEVSPHGT